jgi:hypothetical protein
MFFWQVVLEELEKKKKKQKLSANQATKHAKFRYTIKIEPLL